MDYVSKIIKSSAWCLSLFIGIIEVYPASNAANSVAEDIPFSKQMSPRQKLIFENKKAAALASFARTLNLLETQYVDPEAINIDELVDKAMIAMLSELDPHTAYLTPKQFKNFVSIQPDTATKKVKSTAYNLTHQIIYIKLPLFYYQAYNDMIAQLQEFKEMNHNQLDGLVLDLRNNPGGLFDQAIQITNLFVDSGILVSTVGRDKIKPQKIELAKKQKTFDNFPIIVLVNEKTASASEIVAGALQDRERAIIMGTSTYGKGSVQRVVPLPNGGAMKLTVARYYTPSGRGLQAEGILPDIPYISRSESKLKKVLGNRPLDVEIEKKEVYREIDSWHWDLRNDDLLKKAYLYLRK